MLSSIRLVSIQSVVNRLARANFTPHNYAFGDTPKKEPASLSVSGLLLFGFGNVSTAVV